MPAAQAVVALTEDVQIVFDSEVVNILDAYRQTGRLTEAGGILLGFRRASHIEIVAATVPGPLDRRSRFAFHRDAPHHSETAKDLWRSSGGRIDYVGEWHTHPQSVPSPSTIDRREWQTLAKISPRPLLFVIVGTVAWYLEYGTKRRIVIRAETESG